MVAISLYRGNLHRVPDVPRRWRSQLPGISLHQFKLLIRRRSEALSRLSAAPAAAATPDVKNEGKLKEEDKGDGNGAKVDPSTRREDCSVLDPQPSNSQPKREEDATDHEALREQPKVGASASDSPAGASSARREEEVVRDSGPGGADKVDGKLEVRNNSDAVSGKEERKQELEKKLHVLNEKKHNLVQMLKQERQQTICFPKAANLLVQQILNAEEEIKRRSMQSPVIRPVPQKAEMALEMGFAKQVPKLTVEVNFGSDSGGESDAAANHNSHVRQLHQIHSTSPSAASLTRTTFGSFQHNAGLQSSRASLSAMGHGPTTPNALMGGAMASPSCFAPPAGHQSQTTSLPPPALPVNHFMASSPSPAASGGASSFFMDPHLTSSS